MIKLDYTLKTVEERKQLVEKFLRENPNPPPSYLETLADYVIFLAASQEAKEARQRQRQIITDNRATTINKRETSFEGLAAQFEAGEDGLYGLMTEDKNVIFSPKKMITKKDVENIPALRQLREAITTWDNIAKTTSGRDAYIAKSAAIELRKDQYLIKDSYYVPNTLITSQQTIYPPKMDESVTLDEHLSCHPSGVSFLNPKVIEHILCDYPALKAAAYGKFDHDIWAIMHDFDDLCGRALHQYPLYERLVEYKIDNLSNEKIAEKLQEEFGVLHTDSHLSTLWRKKIPELIAAQAEEEYLFWYCENISSSDDDWKTCTRCNKKKPANENFFSRNTGTKSGFYSICKKCRNESYREKKKTTKGGI